nr:transcriptional regulator [Cruoricaptor ignavus]
MMIKPIRTEKEYDEALEKAYHLIQKRPQESSEEFDELEVLSVLIKNYEDTHFSIPKPHPIEAIKFRMEQMNMAESDLNKILGNRSRKSEIFSGKRRLSLGMIRKLNKELKIPAETLIQEY